MMCSVKSNVIKSGMYKVSGVKKVDNIKFDCQHNDSDEDCNKCCKHGIIWSCNGCEDYKSMFVKEVERNEQI